MTGADYLVMVAILAIALLAACLAAGLINAIGEDRVARLLHLPWGNES